VDTQRSSQAERPSIDALNTLLRRELSAVETYEQAIERLEDNLEARIVLDDCLRAHETRAQRLRQTVASLGGTPSDSSGPWGTFAKLVEGSAKVFGAKAAIAALEEGEDHGLKEYRSQIGKLDATTRQTIVEELLPGQQETRGKLSALKHTLTS
jgi:uncharacterized protein (TIGR02284 family)